MVYSGLVLPLNDGEKEMSGPQEQIQNLYGVLVQQVVSKLAVGAPAMYPRLFLASGRPGIALNGWGKLHNLPRVTEFFASLGLPAPGATAATFVSTFEFVAGILLAVGLLSRVAALGLVIDMLTAYITSDRDSLTSFFSDPSKFYNADPFIYLAFALVILIFGPGKIALDYLIEKKVRESGPSQQLNMASLTRNFRCCSDFYSSKNAPPPFIASYYVMTTSSGPSVIHRISHSSFRIAIPVFFLLLFDSRRLHPGQMK